jgi:hypothetical protein
MGIGAGKIFKSCNTHYTFKPAPAPAPNPDPTRWNLIQVIEFKNAHILLVEYLDYTNFEGVKCMVYKGHYHRRKSLDPHFTDDDNSPIARFKPDEEGVKLATYLAESL